MKAPFKLPVRITDDIFLVAADSELIDVLADATEEEKVYITTALNARDDLVHALLEYKRLYEAVRPTGNWQGVYELGNAALAIAGTLS